MSSAHAIKHLQASGLDTTLLGSKVGAGAGHRVFKYGDNHVVKIPRFIWAKSNLSIITADDAQKNIEHAQQHFENYILSTEIHRSTLNSSYCIVQEWVPSFVNLRSDHIFEHVHLARQFADILRRNQELIKSEGLSLDFFGQEGFIKTTLAALRLSHPQMSNLVVSNEERDPQIYIADSQLFEIRKPENAQMARRMMAEATRWSFELSRLFAKSGFGQDLKH